MNIVIEASDPSWIIIASLLVLFAVIPGLVLFYGGLQRRETLLHGLLQALIAIVIATFVWVICGYTLATTEGNGIFGSFEKLLLVGVTLDSHGAVPEAGYVLYQMAQLSFAVVLLLSLSQTRVAFTRLLLFIPAWILCIYVPVFHSFWGPDGLWNAYLDPMQTTFFQLPPTVDFAGGIVIQLCTGISGLVFATWMGRNHLMATGEIRLIGTDIALSTIGLAFLWIGWFGFTAGAHFIASNAAANAALVTHIAMISACIVWLGTDWVCYQRIYIRGMLHSMLSGLIAISACAGNVSVGGAVAIGGISAICCYYCSHIIRHYVPQQDGIDVYATHAIAGALGAILLGIFAEEAIGGIAGGVEGQWMQLYSQILAVIATSLYVLIATYILCFCCFYRISLPSKARNWISVDYVE